MSKIDTGLIIVSILSLIAGFIGHLVIDNWKNKKDDKNNN